MVPMKPEVTRKVQQAFGPILAICLLGYFVYHLIQGERGVISWMRLNQKIVLAGEKLSQAQTEQTSLAHRVKLMRPDSLDLDMLEEQAREKLGVANSGELIIHDRSLGVKEAAPVE